MGAARAGVCGGIDDVWCGDGRRAWGRREKRKGDVLDPDRMTECVWCLWQAGDLPSGWNQISEASTESVQSDLALEVELLLQGVSIIQVGLMYGM
jgi:hypothetical protein